MYENRSTYTTSGGCVGAACPITSKTSGASEYSSASSPHNDKGHRLRAWFLVPTLCLNPVPPPRSRSSRLPPPPTPPCGGIFPRQHRNTQKKMRSPCAAWLVCPTGSSCLMTRPQNRCIPAILSLPLGGLAGLDPCRVRPSATPDAAASHVAAHDYHEPPSLPSVLPSPYLSTR